jgi:hypothetical protein
LYFLSFNEFLPITCARRQTIDSCYFDMT